MLFGLSYPRVMSTVMSRMDRQSGLPLTSIIVLLGLVVLCVGSGFIGSLFTASSVDSWYQDIEKPGFTPPSWVFGPVWSALYVIMAVAAWLVWREREHASVAPALTLFFVQLALNFAWSLLFFGMESPLAGLIDIAALWLALAATIVAFWRVRPLAGMLLLPYFAWVSFAAALNFEIWRLN